MRQSIQQELVHLYSKIFKIPLDIRLEAAICSQSLEQPFKFHRTTKESIMRRYRVTFKTSQYERVYNVELFKELLADSEAEAAQIAKDLYEATIIIKVKEYPLIAAQYGKE